MKKTATYCGQRVGANGKALYAWLWHDEEDVAYHYKQMVSGASIGGVYEFTLTEDSRVYTGGENAPKLLHTTDDREVAEWRMKSKDAQYRIQAKREEKKLAKLNSDLGSLTLEEIRDEMRRRGNSTARGGLLATVLGYIEAT